MKKKISILLFAVLLTGSLNGQTTLDVILKAKALNEKGNPDQAISLVSAAIVSSNDSKLLLVRAESELLTGDYSRAIADYNSANDLAPLSGEYGLSRIYALKGDAATSVYHLEKSLGSSYRKTEKEVMLDPAFGPVENRAEWRQFWKKDWYSNSEKVVSEIEYDVTAGRIDESEVALKEIKSSYPESDDIKYAEAVVRLAEKRYPEALASAAILAESSPGSEKYLKLLAKAQEFSANPAGASNSYTRLLDLEVADALLFLQRADCYRKTGETGKAIGDIEKYLSFYPDDKAAISLAGKIESATGDNLKAIEYYSRNLKLHPGDPECYIDRANSYFISRSWDWAAKDYSMSLDLKPGNSEIWLNKGIALLNSGKADDACHDFRKAMSLGNKKASEYISRSCIK